VSRIGAVKASRAGGKGWAPTAHTYRHGTPAGVCSQRGSTI